MIININDKVRVRLTEHGRDIWEVSSSHHVRPPIEVEIQLWLLIKLFGPFLDMGCDLIFQENKIELLEVRENENPKSL